MDGINTTGDQCTKLIDHKMHGTAVIVRNAGCIRVTEDIGAATGLLNLSQLVMIVMIMVLVERIKIRLKTQDTLRCINHLVKLSFLLIFLLSTKYKILR